MVTRYAARRSRLCGRVLGIALILTVTSASSGELSGFDCLIEPHSVTEVSTREEGTIAEINVVRGDLIEKNQQLARLESSVEEAAVALARGRTKMVATIEAQRANVKYLERQRERVAKLVRGGAATIVGRSDSGRCCAVVGRPVGPTCGTDGRAVLHGRRP